MLSDKKWRRFFYENQIYRAFVINLALAFFTLIYFILKNKGIFVLCDDFNKQQIPLSMLSNEAIKNGNFFWSWNIDVGTSFVGGTSFYITGSPFFWLSCLFPKNMFPYIVGYIYMLKYAVAGTTSYCYISRFCKDKRYALIGSIMYAFSGFQATNLLFYHFHDVVAIFPLLLIGIEKLINENKKGFLSIAVFLSATLNFYFFIAEIIFLILYFIVRFWIQDFLMWKKIGWCILEGIIGILMSSFIFVPTIAFNMDNPRISIMLPRESWFDFERRYFLKIIRVFLYPADTMSNPSYVLDQDFSSWSAYLPMVGLILVIAYMLKRRDWITKLLLLLALFVVTPILNSTFTLCSISNYHRWYFMLILIMCLASTLVLEERREFPILKVAIIFGVLLVGMTVFSCWWNVHKFQLIFDMKVYGIITGLAFAGTIMVIVITRVFYCMDETFYKTMFICVALFAMIQNAFCCYEYQAFANGEPGNETAEKYYDRMRAMEQINIVEDGYRLDTNDNIITMAAGNMGTGSFISTVNGSIFEFYEMLGGEDRKVFTPENIPGKKELLSAKYYISQEKQDNALQKISYGSYTGYVYEYDKVLPIGFTYDSYITRDEFEKLSSEIRTKVMLDTLVIPNEDETFVKTRLEHANVQNFNAEVGELIEKHKFETSRDFEIKKGSFLTKIDVEKDKYAFFSVPYDKGWSAQVNDRNVPIINCNGFMTIPIDAGNNHIVFRYSNIYLYAGCIMTMIGIVIWFLYFAWGKRNLGRRK